MCAYVRVFVCVRMCVHTCVYLWVRMCLLTCLCSCVYVCVGVSANIKVKYSFQFKVHIAKVAKSAYDIHEILSIYKLQVIVHIKALEKFLNLSKCLSVCSHHKCDEKIVQSTVMNR